jgi:hypothetical protein
MARDGKQLLKFIQQAFAAANQYQTNNYAMSTGTASTGALITSAASTPTASLWYAGQTVAFNRSSFRTMNADQSLLVTGQETSAIANDPAITGNVENGQQYVRFQYAPCGALNTSGVSHEVMIQAASDSGTGTAGTDWTAISASLPINAFNHQGSAYAIKSTSVAVAAGVFTYASAHGFVNGQVIWLINGTPTGFALYQPMFVVNTTANGLSHGVSLVSGSSVTNTALSTSAAITSGVAFGTLPRIVSLPLTPTAKPWIRLQFRAIPNSGTTLAAAAGVWIDNIGIVEGRDTSAVI